MKLEHVALNVPDAREAAAWYAEHLGLRVVKADTAAPHIHFLADGEGSMLEVYSNPVAATPDYASQDPVTLHLAFLVEDMAGERERLLKAGARAEGEAETTPAGDEIAFLRDPWGVTLQLVKRARPLE